MSRQYIRGAGFSLERLTENVPQDGRYYLLQGNAILEVFDTQEDAHAAYVGLCYAYWNRMLGSDDLQMRLQAARGLLRRDRTHRSALEILAVHGDPKERGYAAESLRRLDRQAPMASAAA